MFFEGTNKAVRGEIILPNNVSFHYMVNMKDHLDDSERSNILFMYYTRANTRVCCNICLMCASDPVQIIELLQ